MAMKTIVTDTDKNCGITRALQVIGAKWTALIIRDLFLGPKRFGELERSLAGISPKTLSQRLDQLERDGIISKKIYAEVPPHVEYSLTDKGRTLQGIIDSMRAWGDQIDQHAQSTD